MHACTPRGSHVSRTLLDFPGYHSPSSESGRRKSSLSRVSFSLSPQRRKSLLSRSPRQLADSLKSLASLLNSPNFRSGRRFGPRRSTRTRPTSSRLPSSHSNCSAGSARMRPTYSRWSRWPKRSAGRACAPLCPSAGQPTSPSSSRAAGLRMPMTDPISPRSRCCSAR